ncbi:hypothetical protein RUND412_007702 [Rhizina undulata]
MSLHKHKQPSRVRCFQAPDTKSPSYSFQLIINDNGQAPHGQATVLKSESHQQYIAEFEHWKRTILAAKRMFPKSPFLDIGWEKWLQHHSAVNCSNMEQLKTKIAAKERDIKDRALYGKWEEMGPPTLCIYREGRSNPEAFPELYFGPQELSAESVTCLPLGSDLTTILRSAFSGLNSGQSKEFSRSPFDYSPLPYTANTMRFARKPEVKPFIPRRYVFNEKPGSVPIYHHNEEYNHSPTSTSTDNDQFSSEYNPTTAPSTNNDNAFSSDAVRSIWARDNLITPPSANIWAKIR